MSEFEIGLALLGGLVLVAVVSWNLWVVYRNTPKPKPFVRPKPSESLDTPRASSSPIQKSEGQTQGADRRREPALHAAQTGVQAHLGGQVQEYLHHPASSPMPSPDLAGNDNSVSLATALHDGVDAIALITLWNPPQTGTVALATLSAAHPSGHLDHTSRAGNQPIAVEGLNATTKTWEPPRSDQHYDKFRAGVQLASAGGEITPTRFTEFEQFAQRWADAVGGLCNLPQRVVQLTRAGQLHAFLRQCDVQFVFVLRASQTGWSLEFIKKHAASLGLHAGTWPGRLVFTTPPSEPSVAPSSPSPLFALNYDMQIGQSDSPSEYRLHELVLNLDVPLAPASGEPLAHLYQVAYSLCSLLGAELLHADGTPVRAADWQSIHADLEYLHNLLEQAGMPAGSPLARRVFG